MRSEMAGKVEECFFMLLACAALLLAPLLMGCEPSSRHPVHVVQWPTFSAQQTCDMVNHVSESLSKQIAELKAEIKTLKSRKPCDCGPIPSACTCSKEPKCACESNCKGLLDSCPPPCCSPPPKPETAYSKPGRPPVLKPAPKPPVPVCPPSCKVKVRR